MSTPFVRGPAPDGCVGCQRLRRTRTYQFVWQELFPMNLCAWCFGALLLARPIRVMRIAARRTLTWRR